MAAIVDELRRIPMSQRLIGTLARGAEYAQAQHHPEVSLEHLLLALTEDADATQVLTASHVDLALLKADVSQFLGGLSSVSYPAPIEQLTIAIDLRRILEAAAAAASQGRRREINGAIVLAAIVGDGKSSAAHMLRAQGLTFDEAIKALQRAMAPAPAPPVPDAEDILANARARVQTRTIPGLAPVAPRQQREPVLLSESVAAGNELPQAPEPARDEPPRPEADEAARTRAAGPADDFRDAVSAEFGDAASIGTGGGAIEPQAPAVRHEHSPYGGGGPHPDPFPGDAERGGQFDPPPTEAWPPFADHASEGPELISTPAERPGHQHPFGVGGYAPEPPPKPAAPPQDYASGADPAGHIQRPAPQRQPAPQHGSRWPAPVGPAWDQSEGRQGGAPGAQPGPPPVPAHGRPSHLEAPPRGEISAPPLPEGFGPEVLEGPPGERWAVGYGAEGYAGEVWPEPPGPPPLPPQADADYAPHAGHPYAEGPELPSYPGPHEHQPPPYYSPPAGDAGTHPDGRHIASPPPEPMLPPAPAAPSPGERLAPATEGKRRRRSPVDKAVAGQLVENIPRRMTAHVPVEVEVRLARADAQRMLEGLGGEVFQHPVVVAPAMSVKLRAPDGGFVIDSVSRETQWIENRIELIESEYAIWRWTVTPLKGGRQRLQLLISARTAGPGGVTADTALPDQTVEVRVSVNYGRAILKVASWTIVAAAGGVAAKFGDKAYEPVVEAVMKLIK